MSNTTSLSSYAAEMSAVEFAKMQRDFVNAACDVLAQGRILDKHSLALQAGNCWSPAQAFAFLAAEFEAGRYFESDNGYTINFRGWQFAA
jgi:hypothetical protein|tara:strand:+ start:194 stop:463 length:270 start_codon:yes stop_codon:yes gene_type:complete